MLLLVLGSPTWTLTRAEHRLGHMYQIHRCGDPSALSLVERLCQRTGDDFSVETYERRSPLQVADASLEGELGSIEPGASPTAAHRS